MELSVCLCRPSLAPNATEGAAATKLVVLIHALQRAATWAPLWPFTNWPPRSGTATLQACTMIAPKKVPALANFQACSCISICQQVGKVCRVYQDRQWLHHSTLLPEAKSRGKERGDSTRTHTQWWYGSGSRSLVLDQVWQDWERWRLVVDCLGLCLLGRGYPVVESGWRIWFVVSVSWVPDFCDFFAFCVLFVFRRGRRLQSAELAWGGVSDALLADFGGGTSFQEVSEAHRFSIANVYLLPHSFKLS